MVIKFFSFFWCFCCTHNSAKLETTFFFVQCLLILSLLSMEHPMINHPNQYWLLAFFVVIFFLLLLLSNILLFVQVIILHFSILIYIFFIFFFATGLSTIFQCWLNIYILNKHTNTHTHSLKYTLPNTPKNIHYIMLFHVNLFI